MDTANGKAFLYSDFTPVSEVDNLYCKWNLHHTACLFKITLIVSRAIIGKSRTVTREPHGKIYLAHLLRASSAYSSRLTPGPPGIGYHNPCYIKVLYTILIGIDASPSTRASIDLGLAKIYFPVKEKTKTSQQFYKQITTVTINMSHLLGYIYTYTYWHTFKYSCMWPFVDRRIYYLT